MTCANCHSPKGPPAAIAGKDYSGGLRFDEPPFDVTAPNITPDKETGIGNWTDDQIKTLLLTGKHPNGCQVAEIMPTAFYPILTPGDLNAIVAYLRSLPPVKNKVPDPGLQDRAAASRVPGRREALHGGRSQRQGEARLLPRHHRPLHGVPHAVRGRRRPRISRIRSARAAGNSPGPGACRSRATSLRTRPPASATGPTPRSRPRSPRASARTARRSRARWATSTMPR